jgi:hypothetical protein
MGSSRWGRLGVAALPAIALACAHAPPPALHTARLVVETTRSGGLRPFVPATIAGEPVLLVLDTGAIHSMLPARFARAHGLPRGRSARDARIMDVNGAITVMPVLPDVPVQFGGDPAGTMDFYMNAAAVGAEAVLAPQDLVRSGLALVIDLQHGVLVLEPEDAAVRRLGEGGVAVREEDFDRCLAEGLFEKRHRLLATTVEGIPSKMFIDTGAERTVLGRNHPALPTMTSTLGDRGSIIAIGSAGQGLLVRDVRFEFSHTAFRAPAVVVPTSLPCGHGLLGADLLRHCTIVWGASSLWMACRPPQ